MPPASAQPIRPRDSHDRHIPAVPPPKKEDCRRLFFALWPDAATREALLGATRPLVHATGGRAVAREDLHLTVAFLHCVARSRLDCICEVAHGLEWSPFDLVLERIGYWSRSRILWAGPDQPVAALNQLFVDLWRALGACGFSPERRPFRPHLTLARRASPPPEHPRLCVHWRVDSLVLVESLTAQNRSRYRILERFAPTTGH